MRYPVSPYRYPLGSIYSTVPHSLIPYEPTVRNVYSFAYDGTSWAFLNLETFPEGAQCSAKFGGCLKLGGNLMVFRAATDGTSRPFQTFQWQGAGWSLVPGANLTVTSQSTARL